MNSLNASGKDIIRHTAAIDATVLQEKIEVLNERWRVVCSTVTDRQDRLVFTIFLAHLAKGNVNFYNHLVFVVCRL